MHTRSHSRSLLQIAAFSLVVSVAVAQSCQSRVGDPHDHDAFFKLDGQHVFVACEGCHADGFAGTSTECAGCHEADRPPGHVGDQLGDCGDCHTEFGWFGETGEEQEPPHPCQLVQGRDASAHEPCMPLVDAHAYIDKVQCRDCHPQANNFEYGGLDPACTSCHEEDRPDDHYPTEPCQACHLEPILQWEDGQEHGILYGGLFYLVQTQHKTPQYPDTINAECNECHPAEPQQYLPYTCFSGGCHSLPELEVQHVVAFEYNENSCLSCHVTELTP